jgi:hypothetical protein
MAVLFILPCLTSKNWNLDPVPYYLKKKKENKEKEIKVIN